MKLLDRLFRLEEINGSGTCPTYLYRWTLFRVPGVTCYLHHFVGDDWSRDLHDHPKRFISIGLWGQYIEYTPHGRTHFFAPWIRSFPATHIHRLVLNPVTRQPCWTLVFVLRAVREWGFWRAGRWVHWRTYVNSASDKDCV